METSLVLDLLSLDLGTGSDLKLVLKADICFFRTSDKFTFFPVRLGSKRHKLGAHRSSNQLVSLVGSSVVLFKSYVSKLPIELRVALGKRLNKLHLVIINIS